MSSFKKYLVFMTNHKAMTPVLRLQSDKEDNAFLLADALQEENPEKEVLVLTQVQRPTNKK